MAHTDYPSDFLPMRPAIRRKIAVLGAKAVGKSSFIRRAVHGTYDSTYRPTIISTVQMECNVDNVPFQLEIIDSAGQDEYTRLPKEACLGVHGYILAYDVTNPASFRAVSATAATTRRERLPLAATSLSSHRHAYRPL